MNLVLPEGVIHIDHWAYTKSDVMFLWLPDSLRTIGMCSFKDCPNLTEVSMSPNSYCNYRIRLEGDDGIFANCPRLEQITFRGALRNYTWHDAAAPELLRGCHREKTFHGCVRLRRLVAREIPLESIPAEWRQYAINGFIADVERDQHYSPLIAGGYHAYLESNRQQLINRTAGDQSYSLYQYLIDRRMITAADFETIFMRANAANSAETTAALLEYQFRVLRQSTFEISLE
ncbi:MAG: leucine-rich repeat domain-containing protein [Treponema sp.]|jgi:hypothetical protein|nr:leucine-rich repeat domain-containing protein [Treponema sp.]